MLTLLEIIKRTTEFFEKREIESARLNAELLVGHALGLKRMQLYMQFERPLTEIELEKIRPLVKRRGAREPLQYIIGTVEFAGLSLKVDRRALIPRPETEYLVELIEQHAPRAPERILDLGTGSGALALALAAKFPHSRVTAVDRDEEALALARENVAALGLGDRVELVASDWYDRLPAAERYSLVVANPPYLSDDEVAQAAPEVRNFEPHGALSAGRDGTTDLSAIIQGAIARLTGDGWLACETGIAQRDMLVGAAAVAKFSRAEVLADLTGRDRYLLAFV